MWLIIMLALAIIGCSWAAHEDKNMEFTKALGEWVGSKKLLTYEIVWLLVGLLHISAVLADVAGLAFSSCSKDMSTQVCNEQILGDILIVYGSTLFVAAVIPAMLILDNLNWQKIAWRLFRKTAH